MKIYIDFDDVISETGRYFSKLAKELFGIDLPYSQFQFFNIQKTFGLSDEQYDALMVAGHRPESLLAFEHVAHFDGCTVAVYERPWNRAAELPDGRFVRCAGWPEIEALAEKVCPKGQ